MFPTPSTSNFNNFDFQIKNLAIKKTSINKDSGKGCISYSGNDINTKKKFYIMEWKIKYSRIKTKCFKNCFWFEKSTCEGHNVDDFIKSIEMHVNYLSKLQHKNLVMYNSVKCLKKDENEELIIYLVQDYVDGLNLSHIKKNMVWHAENVTAVVNTVLDVLKFLHDHNRTHNYLYDRTVFLDKEQLKCGNFTLIFHLAKLINKATHENEDIPALGNLIKDLMPILPQNLYKFVKICHSNIPVSELINHSLLKNQNENEYEIIEKIGEGTFGEVYKVRNKVDDVIYAEKQINFLPNKKFYAKIKKEAEVWSRLEHENIVRYYGSRIEEKAIENSSNDITVNMPSVNSPKQLIQEDVNMQSLSNDIIMKSISSSKQHTQEDVDMPSVSNDISMKSISSSKQNKQEVVTMQSISKSNDSQSHYLQNSTTRRILCIQMKFCENGTLRNAINGGLHKKSEKMWRLFKEIIEGLCYIHAKKIIHRDLKPSNIYLDANDQIKIGDFGLATFSELENSNDDTNNKIVSYLAGTGLYRAPEILTRNFFKSSYTEKVDMYALGIILFEMNIPYVDSRKRDKAIELLRYNISKLPKEVARYYNKGRRIYVIIQSLIENDPTKRPSAKRMQEWRKKNFKKSFQKTINLHKN